jgi:UDP-glucose 4-epimerase
VSKRTGELYLGYYQAAFGLPYVALRYANVYGPRQSSKGEAGVVAIFIDRLLSGNPPIINGDGKQTRDYVYVGDVVAANLAALRTPFVGAVNIGTGRETDVVTICRFLREGLGSGIEATHGPAKPGEQRRSCLAVGFAAKVLGWRPKTPIERGLQETIASWRQARGQ